jgi:hypothetical protein
MHVAQQDWVRRLNYLGSAVGGARRLVSLAVDELLDEARASTGLGDFGEPGWEEAFRRLVDSLENDVALHTLGRLMTRAELLRALRNRLFITDAYRQTPAIAQERIVAPLLIAGQGRTGTSILFELLALDENNRAPLAWEAASPVEPPPAALGDGIGRGEIAQTVNEFFADVQPAISAAHEYRWDLPVECIRFMDSDFSSDWWATFYGAWGWLEWRSEHPSDAAYRWHRRVLQVLQAGQQTPRRWLLKSPAHIGNLDKLLRQYPDIRIIHTHRDPVRTVPSTVSLSLMMRSSRANDVDVALLGQLVVRGYAGMLGKVIEERRSGLIPSAQIADLHFRDLMQHPVRAVEEVYAALGLPFSGRFADAIRDYLARKPRDRLGKHRYRAQDYGLSNDGIRDAFRFYTDHYRVALED